MSRDSVREKNYNKGREFQDYVKELLQRSGYPEGLLYSTGGSYFKNYYKRLKRLGKDSITSPDIIVLNNWGNPDEDLDKRFAISCSMRGSYFEWDEQGAVTLPRYQSYGLNSIQDGMNLPIYMVFGRPEHDGYAIGVSRLKEPDGVVRFRDRSTGSLRYNDVFYTGSLWSWKKFMIKRIVAGDKEPTVRLVSALHIPKIQ